MPQRIYHSHACCHINPLNDLQHELAHATAFSSWTHLIRAGFLILPATATLLAKPAQMLLDDSHSLSKKEIVLISVGALVTFAISPALVAIIAVASLISAQIKDTLYLEARQIMPAPEPINPNTMLFFDMQDPDYPFCPARMNR